MIKVFGHSDDCVEIKNAKYAETEINCSKNDVKILFCDGTVIRVGYSKPGMGVWYIIVEERGYAMQSLGKCFNEGADVYSDVFEIDSEIKSHEFVERYEWSDGEDNFCKCANPDCNVLVHSNSVAWLVVIVDMNGVARDEVCCCEKCAVECRSKNVKMHNEVADELARKYTVERMEVMDILKHPIRKTIATTNNQKGKIDDGN